jgi:soluble lytic murein transglycosylase-like protein
VLLFAVALAGPRYYTCPTSDGAPFLTDSPTVADCDPFWDDPMPGMFLSTGVPMPRLDRIANLDAYDAHFAAEGRRVGLEPELLKAVAVAESRMNPDARSPAGARGLMQLMPSTARSLGVRDSWDPAQSIAGGAAYLSRQVARFGSRELALAAYNAGPEAVARARAVPDYPETRTYVARVMGLYQHFRDRRPILQ